MLQFTPHIGETSIAVCRQMQQYAATHAGAPRTMAHARCLVSASTAGSGTRLCHCREVGTVLAQQEFLLWNASVANINSFKVRQIARLRGRYSPLSCAAQSQQELQNSEGNTGHLQLSSLRRTAT